MLPGEAVSDLAGGNSQGKHGMENIKLHLEFGPLRLDFEGPSEFVNEGLSDFIKCISDLEIQDMVLSVPADGGVSVANVSGAADAPKLSTTDFAVKMGAKSGSDLVMAAAAFLHHTRGIEEFRRGDLLDSMKSAKAFYKASYGGNLSKSLEVLVKSGRLQNPKSDTYALPYPEIESTKRLLQ